MFLACFFWQAVLSLLWQTTQMRVSLPTSTPRMGSGCSQSFANQAM
jgi:hypothetical protein